MKKKLELKKEVISELTRGQLSSLKGGNYQPTIDDPHCVDPGEGTEVCVLNTYGTCNLSSALPEIMCNICGWTVEECD